MKIQTFICLCTLPFFLSCEDHSNKDFEHTTVMKSVVVKSDTYFHYSNWYAFENKVFDTDLNVSTLKANGDISIGADDADKNNYHLNKHG